VRPRLNELRDRATTPGASSALALAGALLLALIVRISIGARVEAPLLLCDEFIYAELAQSFADEGRLLLRGEPSYQSVLYPILLAPAWLGDSAETAYELTKSINALLLAAAAVVVYLWGRNLVSPGWALLAPVLTLLIPAQLYSGLILSENAFLPAFVLAAYAVARAIEAPSKRRQLLVLLAIAAACAVRVQGLVLLVILPTAVFAAVLVEVRLAAPGHRLRQLFDGIRPWWPSAAVLVGAACGYVIVQLAQAESFSEGFGSYQDVITRGYTLEDGWQFGKLHLAALALAVGLVPMSALIVLAAQAISNPDRATAGQRALVAVATASTFWLVVEVGIFTSRFGGSIAERYIFHGSPILFLVLAVWLAEGLPRPWLATAAAAVFPGALVISEPLGSHLGPGLLINSFTLFGFFDYTDDLGGMDNLVWAWRVGAVVAAFSFAVLWRPVARVLIPVGIAIFFVVMQRPGDKLLVQHSTGVRFAPGIGESPSWVDARVGPDTPVDFLYTPPKGGEFDRSTIMLHLKFWNRSVKSVVNVGTPEVCPLPERAGRINFQSGRITVPGRTVSHLVVEKQLPLAGSVLAREGPFVLYRIAPPLSLSLPAVTTDGVFHDGWTGAEASFTQNRTRRGRQGRAAVEISRAAWTGPDVPGNVTIRVGRVQRSGAIRWAASRRLVIHSGETRSVSLPTPKPPFRVQIQVDPTFSPSTFGSSDTRQLGVQVTYRFVS
jgi:hypothetical protein